MKLHSIELRDFRGISNLSLPFDQELTVIVGDNGIGKTSILDALYLSLFGLLSLWPDKAGNPNPHIPPVESSDVTKNKQDFMITTRACVFSEIGQDQILELNLCSNNNKNVPDIVALRNQGSNLKWQEENERPLFVYYRQNRGFSFNVHVQNQTSVSADQMRAQSLSKDLQAIQDLSSWWDKLDAQEARRHRDEEPGYRDPQLEAIRELVGEMEEFETIGYNAKSERPGLYLKKTLNPEFMSINSLARARLSDSSWPTWLAGSRSYSLMQNWPIFGNRTHR